MAACRLIWILLLALITHNGPMGLRQPAALARRMDEPAAGRGLLAAAGSPAVSKSQKASAASTQPAPAVRYKTGISSQGSQLFMCVVVGGEQCSTRKDVLGKLLREDVKQLVRRMGIKTAPVSVTMTSIQKVCSGFFLCQGWESHHTGSLNMYCSTALHQLVDAPVLVHVVHLFTSMSGAHHTCSTGQSTCCCPCNKQSHSCLVHGPFCAATPTFTT
jgi:hypothetical protein